MRFQITDTSMDSEAITVAVDGVPVLTIEIYDGNQLGVYRLDPEGEVYTAEHWTVEMQ